jgi:hypothetical protein
MRSWSDSVVSPPPVGRDHGALGRTLDECTGVRERQASASAATAESPAAAPALLAQVGHGDLDVLPILAGLDQGVGDDRETPLHRDTVPPFGRRARDPHRLPA